VEVQAAVQAARRARAGHQVHLVAHTTPAEPPFSATLAGLSTRLAEVGADSSRATMQAYGRLYRIVMNQAAALAYNDMFWLLAYGAAVMVPLSLLLRRNDPRSGGASVAAH